jgi:hypothetical protein
MMPISTNKISTVIIPLLILILFSSCASMSTMQTARTTDKNKFAYIVGLSVVKTDIPIGTIDTIKINAPVVDLGVRYGVTDKLDVGAKISIIGTATIDVKYQFLGDKTSKIAGSIGLGGGYISLQINASKIHLYDFMLPVYFSYHPTNWLGLYCCPKYVFRITNNNDYINNTITNISSHWYGATGGIRIGKRIAFLAEYSYFGTSQLTEPFSQISGGISIGFE